MGYAMSTLSFIDCFNKAVEEKIDRGVLDKDMALNLLRTIQANPIYQTIEKQFTIEEHEDMSLFKGILFLGTDEELMDTADFYGNDRFGEPVFTRMGIVDFNGLAMRIFFGEQAIYTSLNGENDRAGTDNGWIVIQLLS